MSLTDTTDQPAPVPLATDSLVAALTDIAEGKVADPGKAARAALGIKETRPALLVPDDIPAPWPAADKQELCDLIVRARAEGKWLSLASMLLGPLWLSPSGLTAQIKAGNYCFGAVNWRLADPAEYTAHLTNAIASASTGLAEHLNAIAQELEDAAG